MLQIPEIKAVARKTGRAELDEHALGINVSEIEAPFELDGRSRREFMDAVRHKLEALPGVNIEIGQPISHRIDAMLSGTRANIAIKVFGPDLREIRRTAEQIKLVTEGIDGLVDVNVEPQVMRPQVKVTPRREVMAEYGLDMPSFVKGVEALSAGIKVSEVFEGNIVTDIVVRMNEGSDFGAEELRQTPVATPADRKSVV